MKRSVKTPFEIGDTVVEWAGSFGRYPSRILTIKKVYKKYVLDDCGHTWRFDGFTHPKKDYNSNKIELITDAVLFEIRTWHANSLLRALLDDVSREIRRGDVELDAAEALFAIFQEVAPEAEKIRASKEEHDGVAELLAKHPRTGPLENVSLPWVLNQLAGMSFPKQGQAYDFIKKAAVRL